MEIGTARPAVVGLITYPDGSYWLGEVVRALWPDSAQGRWSMSPPMTFVVPVPGGVGEWGFADGARVQGVAVPARGTGWLSNAWSDGMFAFHMRQLERAMASDGTPLAGSLRIAGGTVLGSPVVATAALQQEGSVGYLQAGTARIDVDQVVHPTVAPVLPVSEVAPVSGAVMNSVDVRASSPALPDGGRVAGELDAGTIARIDQWAAALHPDTFVADRSDVLESNLMRGRQFNRHFSQCRQTHGGVNTLQLRFAHPAAHIRSYQGMAQGCTFPAQPDDNVFGRITYADGSYWLGPVIASPQPQALALGAFGAMPGSVWLLVPAPAGKGNGARPMACVTKGRPFRWP